MSVKEHYDDHLAGFYSWMAGDFEFKQREQQDLLEAHGIKPLSTRVALDMGAGHGLQSVSLAKVGFRVTAIDFNKQLLGELEKNKDGLDVQLIEDDILNVSKYASLQPELIVCAGDTIAHLASGNEIERFVGDCKKVLVSGGKLVLTFRDYSNALEGSSRFIPVKSDDARILTCFLEYFDDKVRVTDLLHERREGKWVQKVSSYFKVRVGQEMIVEIAERAGFKILHAGMARGMVTVVAQNL